MKRAFLGNVLAFITLTVTLLLQSCNSDVKHELIVAKGDSLPEYVDYNIHIRPILSDKCFNCHGPDANKREANLRLDIPEGAFEALGERGDHYAIVPKDLEKSEVFKRIITNDPKLAMPVPSSNLPKLTSLEIATVAKWIAQGAEYKPLWSTIIPKKYDVPSVKSKEWPKNEIDNFVLAKLEKEGLKPAPEAEKERLLRRITFDLTGLPPTIKEMDDFLKDNSPNAYEKVVDRLFASPHYGERMAADWMDVTRYGDSHGYQDDGYRNTWHWRDWVINSFNENLPYDKFMTWQLAGDLLPNATKEQVLASGFNRNHPQNQEGGIIFEEYRVEYVLDRTGTTAKAFLGLTMECARCHDHKYDPITQKEFYQFSAFFNQNDEPGQITNYGVPGPTQLLTSKEMDDKLAFMKGKVKAQEKVLAQVAQKNLPAFEKWYSSITDKSVIMDTLKKHMVSYYPIDSITTEKVKADPKKKIKAAEYKYFVNSVIPKNHFDIKPTNKLVPGVENKGLEINGEASYIPNSEGNFENTTPFSYSIWVKPSIMRKDGMMLINKKRSVYDGGYTGYDLYFNEDTTLSARLIYSAPFDLIRVTTKDKIKLNQWSHLTLTYDASSTSKGLKIYINGQQVELIVNNDNLRKSFNTETAYYQDLNMFVKKHAHSTGLMLGEDTYNQGMPTLEKCVVDELKIFNKELTPLEIKDLNNKNYLKQVLSKNLNQLSKQDKNDLHKIYLDYFSKDYKQTLDTLTAFRNRHLDTMITLEEVMIMTDSPNKRKTYVLNRGVYDAHADTVEAGTPKAVLPYSKDLPKNRLGLAQWMTDPKNPLPARVIVNRYWQMYFGIGLVSTSGDFGNQGSLPSHPELLDFLSVKFVESGWNVKAMQKMIVMSATYRQSSKLKPELYAKDPQNILLAHGPRHRFSFEMIRDNALAISKLINDTIGGPSVFPYQPKNIWEEKTSGRHLKVYVQSRGSDLYRRTLYTFFKRTAPPPSLMTFDASDRAYCTVKKNMTNTPLQALVIMNDPQVLEAGRVLAERIMLEGGKTPEQKISYAFRLATGRKANEKEIKILTSLYEKELNRFKKDSKSAAGFLNVGEFAINRTLNAYELAAYSVVTHTILNLDETLNKS